MYAKKLLLAKHTETLRHQGLARAEKNIMQCPQAKGVT
jgi:hypothetical protein